MAVSIFKIAKDSNHALMDSIMSFLRTQLDDDQLKELADTIGGSSHEDAADALQALNETSGVLGQMATPAAAAQDTASNIYRKALKQMGGIAMDSLPSNLPAPALRAIFRVQAKHRLRTGQPLIRPTAEAIRSFEERFPKAAKINLTAQRVR